MYQIQNQALHIIRFDLYYILLQNEAHARQLQIFCFALLSFREFFFCCYCRSNAHLRHSSLFTYTPLKMSKITLELDEICKVDIEEDHQLFENPKAGQVIKVFIRLGPV